MGESGAHGLDPAAARRANSGMARAEPSSTPGGVLDGFYEFDRYHLVGIRPARTSPLVRREGLKMKFSKPYLPADSLHTPESIGWLLAMGFEDLDF